MLSIDPKDIPTPKLHGYLLGAVSPRPIAFASTVDSKGNVNLSPFSFFNVFSANPPIMVFSPARRVRDNTTKHTLENVLEVPETVINIVDYNMVQQMSLSSTEYPKGVNEFVKAGLTEIASEVVQPPRVAESPAHFECLVKEVIELGEEGGAGNLIIAEVVKLHISEAILDDNSRIDPAKIDAVARMGGNWYSRSKVGMFEVPKPLSSIGIGVDALPVSIKNSEILSGNDLGILANVDKLPTQEEVNDFIGSSEEVNALIKSNNQVEIHKRAKQMVLEGSISEAWKLLLSIE